MQLMQHLLASSMQSCSNSRQSLFFLLRRRCFTSRLSLLVRLHRIPTRLLRRRKNQAYVHLFAHPANAILRRNFHLGSSLMCFRELLQRLCRTFLRLGACKILVLPGKSGCAEPCTACKRYMSPKGAYIISSFKSVGMFTHLNGARS